MLLCLYKKVVCHFQRQFYLDKMGLGETENDTIENSFLKEEDKEKLKRLIDRW